jgi:biotin carboxylase
MVTRQRTGLRPRLAVVFSPQVLVLQLVEAARGVREIIWLVDRSTSDVDGSLRLLERMGRVVDITGLSIEESADLLAVHEPDGIVAFAESELMRSALIGGCLGLPVQSPGTVMRLTNKLAQRQALRAAGLPSPRFWAVPVGSDAAACSELCRVVCYPAIVKPQVGEGSRGVYRVADAAALSQMLEQQRGDRAVDLIVEELLCDGWSREQHPYADLVSVESIVACGQLSHIAVTGRTALVEPFRETGDFIPSNLPVDLTDEIMDVAGQAVRVMGADTGVFHTEVKVTPQGPYVIEVNGRVGGSIPEILALATDHAFSFLDIVCRVALGHEMTFEAPVPCHRVGYSIFEPPPLGATHVTRLDHLDEVGRIPGVEALLVNRQAGDPVDWRDGYDGRLYSIYGVADDHAEMWAARRRVLQTVAVEFA